MVIKLALFFCIVRDLKVKRASIRLKIDGMLYKISWFNIP